MDIAINLTQKELEAIGVTREVLQDLLIDQIDALKHNDELIIHQVETSLEVVVTNEKLPGLLKDDIYEPITVFDYVVKKYNIPNIEYRDFWFQLVRESGDGGVQTLYLDDYLEHTESDDKLYLLYQAIRSEYGTEVNFNCAY